VSRAARDLIRRAAAAGWSVAPTRGGHLRFTHPEASVPVFTASTPSDHRALANALATMRRALAPDQRRKLERPGRGL